jgi:hypothetical protein
VRIVRTTILLAALGLSSTALAQQARDDEWVPAASASSAEKKPKVAPEEVPSGDGTIKDWSEKRRPITISAMGFVPFLNGIGIGLKTGVEIPVVHNGFIPKLNDSFSVEPTFSVAYSTWYSLSDVQALTFIPAVAGMWSFHFAENLRAYAALNLGYSVVSWKADFDTKYLSNESRFYGEVTVGGFYKFADRFAARAEVGWEGLRGGIAFLL